MARRAATVGAGNGGGRNEVDGSVFDLREPPPLPPGMSADVHAIAQDIVATNPHLWDISQVPNIVRLANMRAHFEIVNQEVLSQGPTTVNRYGEFVPNPLLKILTSVNQSTLALERGLGIVFVTRNHQVKKAEKVAPGSASEAPRSVVGAPKLHLA